MREADVIVVGGGPAGVSAAIEAAKSGLSVMLCEQRPALGGAIHRQPAEGATPVAVLPSLRGRWQALSAELSASGVDVRTRRAFVGVDSTGAVLIEDRAAGKVEVRRPRALILSCGAVERVRPRRGWHLPGVAAAGGLQVMLKEGRVPGGRILLAGSGPLLLALAAQMTAAGNPPVAVIEEGDPASRPLAGVRLLAHPSVLPDMAALMMPVLFRRVVWRRGTRLTEITQSGDMLTACLIAPNGREERIEVDRIGLHDGLRPNDFGLPANDAAAGLVILRAGDVREVLGAHAAEADGAEAGRRSCGTAGRAPAAQWRERDSTPALSADQPFPPFRARPRCADPGRLSRRHGDLSLREPDDQPSESTIVGAGHRFSTRIAAQRTVRHGRLPGALLLRMDAFTDVRTAPHSLSAKYRRNGRLPLAVAARSSVVARKRWHERRHTDRTAYGGDLGMTLQAR